MIENSLIPKMINFKLIESERTEDAPFVGALVSACDCKFNCKNCFNQKIKALPTLSKPCEEIVAEIQSNPFHKGVIFAGLEWTLQLDECIALARACKEKGLLTMIYTGNDWQSELAKKLVEADCFDYIKCGQYAEDLKTVNHIEYGVVLASSNQHIYKKGMDYAKDY